MSCIIVHAMTMAKVPMRSSLKKRCLIKSGSLIQIGIWLILSLLSKILLSPSNTNCGALIASIQSIESGVNSSLEAALIIHWTSVASRSL